MVHRTITHDFFSEILSSLSLVSSVLCLLRGLEVEEYGRKESSLSLRDILPFNPKAYDKHRPPKFAGQPTVVYFHVTVLSIDSINEESMVRLLGYWFFVI